jgi:uncharacterized membrane protein
MKNVSKTIAVIAGLILLFSACTKSSSSGGTGGGGGSAVNCSTVEAKFAANVLPLIQTSCNLNSSCHASGSVNTGGPLTNFAQISAKAASIKGQVASGAMPKSGTLTAAQKAVITCWVDGGAQNN